MSPSHSATPPAYTGIPISVSAADVITRSLHNLHGAVSRSRPWPELFSGLTLPDSFQVALTRIRHNAAQFRVNYILLIGACGALSLAGSPGWLLAAAAVVGLWLVIYFFREDPLELGGRHVSDWAVLVGLILISVLVAWASGGLGGVLFGLGVGLVVCGLHGVVRDTEGLFLSENDAASQGLIGPTTPAVK